MIEEEQVARQMTELKKLSEKMLMEQNIRNLNDIIFIVNTGKNIITISRSQIENISLQIASIYNLLSYMLSVDKADLLGNIEKEIDAECRKINEAIDNGNCSIVHNETFV